MNLTPKQISFLRSKAHPLEPLFQLGKQGVSEGFQRQVEEALREHELIKLRVGRHVEVDLRALAADFRACLVQNVGRTFVLYRPSDEPSLRLPEG